MYNFHQSLFFLLFSLFICQVSYGAEKTVIEGDWKFQYGDNPKWAQFNIDDSNWSTVEVPSLIKQLHKTSTTGWYRIHFNANVDINEPQALLIEYLRHSDETWINGIRVGGEGKFEQLWRFNNTNPQGLTRVYAIPAGFLKETDNVLAIKVSIGFGNALGAMFPGGAGILLGNVYIGEAKTLNDYKQQQDLKTTSVDIFFITLGLVELFIIIFLLKQAINTFPEYKWLFFTSLVMLLGSIGHDAFYIQGWTSIKLNLLLVIALLCMPISVALYFWAQYKNIKTEYVQWVTGIWGVLSLLIIIPWVSSDIKITSWYMWMVLAALFFLYSFYCAFRGIFLGKSGAIAQLIAITIFILSIRTQWLPDNLFGHRNVQIGSLLYRYALLFAYFQQIKGMTLDYKNLSNHVVKTADNIYANIARELHDGIGQHLASMKLQTKLAQSQVANKHMKNIEYELQTSVIELRRLLAGLHPILIDKYSLPDALKRESLHIEEISKSTVTLDLDDSIEIDKPIEHQVFRIFQECINNAINHGRASKISISLSIKNNILLLNINDNGAGFDIKKKSEPSNNGGLGLISLHERIALLNGFVNISSAKNKGTEIHIKIPL